MPYRRTTFSKFIIEDERRRANPEPELTGLLNDVQTACKFIASAVARGALASDPSSSLAATANAIMLQQCEFGGSLVGMISRLLEQPYQIPAAYPRGRYLLAFDPLEGVSNLDVDVTVGTIFSILRAPEGIADPSPADFLQAGTRQLAAGFALYGPAAAMVLTLGNGVHGFTLDREIGAYMYTHPDMRIPESTRDFAIDASNQRFWEPPIRHYVEECVEGEAGPRGTDFNMRWVDSLVADVYRILVRGGLFIYPRDTKDPSQHGRLRQLYEANPIAMIVEQAGGAASTGRERILEVVPAEPHARIPVILGSREEVARLDRYHQTYDRGEELAFATPLFKTRSLFRTV
jgi:fructose-1,6-bisphosphatase I